MRKRTSTAALREDDCPRKSHKNDKTAIDNMKADSGEVKALLMRISTKLTHWVHKQKWKADWERKGKDKKAEESEEAQNAEEGKSEAEKAEEAVEEEAQKAEDENLYKRYCEWALQNNVIRKRHKTRKTLSRPPHTLSLAKIESSQSKVYPTFNHRSSI